MNAPAATATILALEELRSRHQWVCWRKEVRQGKPTKVPYDATTGKRAESDNPETWASYEQAQAAFERSNGHYDGIGFAFNDDYTGVDWDHCIDEQGNIDAWAKEDIDLIKSYSEVSPSETGIHGIARGVLPEKWSEKKQALTRPGTRKHVPGQRHEQAAIELYCEGRFFTITGNHLPGTPSTIEARQEQILDLHKRVTAPKQKEKKSTSRSSPDVLSLSDNDLLDIAHKAKNRAKFAALWRGDTSGYLSQSEADQALCNLLAFWTGKDKAQMQRLFERSGLHREKWDRHPTYASETLDKAIGDCTEVFTPGSTKGRVLNTSSNGHSGDTGGGSAPVDKVPHSFNCTDLGNAERFAVKHKHTVRWCETWNTWIVFNGKCWESDRTGRVDQLAKAVVRSIYHEVAEEEDKERFDKLKKHAAASESNRAIRAMLDRAKSELPATPDQFNTHLYLLNCKNGTLDLRTGELRPHNPQDFLTRCVKVNYNPLALCPGWETFIQTIFSDDQGLVIFIQQSLGMSLTGDISEQCLFICHGEGSNGKTTMIEIIRKIMQDYGLAANIETFQIRKNEAVRNDIAELYGARFVSASENVIGSRLNEAFIKKATGDEPLRARRLHENEFEFMPEFTIWIAVNHKPVVKDTTKGMWRRVHFIPFLVTFDEQAADKHFGKKLLAAESEGILAWLVRGCIAWYQQGRLTVPETVRKATQAYRAEMDTVAHFLETECNLKSGLSAKSKQLTERYESWCKQNSESFDAKDLKRGLNERGFHSKRGTGGIYLYHGIGLIDDPTPPPTTDISEGSEGSELKNRVILRETETSQKLPNFSSLPSLPSLSEHETCKNSEGTFTDSPQTAQCMTTFESMMSSPHGQHEATLQDEAGNWWCADCQGQHDLMNIGQARGYPAFDYDNPRDKRHTLKCKSGLDAWLQFCKTMGYTFIRRVLEVQS